MLIFTIVLHQRHRCSHISFIKRCGFASLTASYIWETNRDWFIDIPAKLPRDLAEQAAAEERDRQNKVIENEREGWRLRDWESYTRFAVTRWDARDDKTISLTDRPLWQTWFSPLTRNPPTPPPPSLSSPNTHLPFILALVSHIPLLLLTESNKMNRSRGEMSSWRGLGGVREHIWQNQIRSVKDEACHSPGGAANGISTAQMTRVLWL